MFIHHYVGMHDRKTALGRQRLPL